jgi:hypothetical protein
LASTASACLLEEQVGSSCHADAVQGKEREGGRKAGYRKVVRATGPGLESTTTTRWKIPLGGGAGGREGRKGMDKQRRRQLPMPLCTVMSVSVCTTWTVDTYTVELLLLAMARAE